MQTYGVPVHTVLTSVPVHTGSSTYVPGMIDGLCLDLSHRTLKKYDENLLGTRPQERDTCFPLTELTSKPARNYAAVC